MKLLMGGTYSGGSNWNKAATDIDKCFKIYYYREGKSEILSCDKSHSLLPGNLYFINGYSIVSQKCCDTMLVDWIHFNPESVYFNHLLKFSSCVQALNFSEFTSFTNIFEHLQSFFDNTLQGSLHKILQLEIQSFIQLVLAKVFNSLDPRVFEKDEAFIRLMPTLEFITENYRKNISLEDIASRSHLSPNYLHRLFTKTFHVSPFSYIRTMRMEEAVRQLIYSHKTVKEIAYDSGYEDEAYFSRTFKKRYQVSPGKYRMAYRKKLP